MGAAISRSLKGTYVKTSQANTNHIFHGCCKVFLLCALPVHLPLTKEVGKLIQIHGAVQIHIHLAPALTEGLYLRRNKRLRNTALSSAKAVSCMCFCYFFGGGGMEGLLSVSASSSVPRRCCAIHSSRDVRRRTPPFEVE